MKLIDKAKQAAMEGAVTKACPRQQFCGMSFMVTDFK